MLVAVPTITFAFPDAAQAATFFAAISRAYVDLAAGVTAAFAPSAPANTGAVQSGDSPGTAGLKEFLAEQPPASAIETIPDTKPKATRKSRKQADFAAPPAAAPTAAPTGPVTVEQLRAEVLAVLGRDEKNGNKIADLFARYGVAKCPELPEDKRAEFLQALKAIA